MKKKILFLICIALSCMALAIIGSATTYYTDGTTEYLECEIADTYHIDSYIVKNGGFPKVDADGDALTWYLVSTETDSETGHVTKTVASVKTKDVYNGETATYTGIDKNLIVSANYENDTANVPVFGAFSGEYNKELLFIYIPDAVTTLPYRFCQNVPVVICEFTENSMCSSWNNLVFWGAKSLREIFIPKHFVKFPGSSDGEFNSCKRLEKLTFAEDSIITSIPSWYFSDTKIKEMILPDSVTTINHRLFQGMKYLEYVRFGPYVNSIENTQSSNDHFSLFHDCGNLKTVVIPGTLLAENIGTNGNKLTYGFSTGSPTFIYTGTLEEFQKIQAVFAEYDNNGSLTNATVENGRIVIANHCEIYFDSEHLDADANCNTEGECERKCGVTLEAKEHNITVNTFEYPNGFASQGVRNYLCTNSGCTVVDIVNKTENAIFGTSGGYSTDGKGISGGWTVDTTLLKEYNNLHTASPVTFGIVIVNPSHLIGNSFFNEDKQINVASDGKGALQVEMSSTEYTNFSAFITGFTGYESLELIITAYAYAGDGAVEFLQDASSSSYVSTIEKSDATLKTVSFEKVCEIADIQTLDANVPSNKEEI